MIKHLTVALDFLFEGYFRICAYLQKNEALNGASVKLHRNIVKGFQCFAEF